jgi:3-methyladenine DNA glycosylase AlkC
MLVESYAIDFQALLTAVAPHLEEPARRRLDPADGITRRMAAAGELLLEHEGPAAFARLAEHPSDTVRGWAAYLLAAVPQVALTERLARIRPLALDEHFGVREWAWIALRPHVAGNVEPAIQRLLPWVRDPHPYARRFAIEITRPRGVWCAHIPRLKEQPELGLPLLEPLAAEPRRYVQDSVANWLNDASKSAPGWVRALCSRWHEAGDSDATRYICRRALRSIGTDN